MIRIFRPEQPTPVPPANDAVFVDVRAEIDGLLTEARAQAEAILAEAERRAGEIRQQARQEGREAAGQEHARDVAAGVGRELQTVLPAVHAAVAAIQTERVRQLRCWEQDLVRLAVAIAGRIVRGELQRQPRIPLEWIREALELAVGSPVIKLHLHPSDQETLGEPLRRLLENLGEGTTLEVLADPEVQRGGCLVVTEQGRIDQQLDTQLTRIENELV